MAVPPHLQNTPLRRVHHKSVFCNPFNSQTTDELVLQRNRNTLDITQQQQQQQN